MFTTNSTLPGPCHLPALLAALFMLLPCLLLPCPSQAADNEHWKIENLRQEIELGEARLLDLENAIGELHVRGGSDGPVELYATVQRHVDDPDRPRIEPRIEGDRFTLDVSYPQERESLPAPWRKRRVDLVLYVPADVVLELESVHEKLRVKGFAGDVLARSVTGAISIITSGKVEARSDYGDIDVQLTGSALDGSALEAKLETLTGDISLTLGSAAQPRARLESRGLLTSDYSIDIEWTTASRKRGLVGGKSGEPTLLLTSERGDLKLLRRPSPPAASTP